MTPVLRVKPSVVFATIRPGGFRLIAALDTATRVMGQDLLISCGTEGHAFDDPHTRGEAVDLSVNGFAEGQILALVDYLRKQLGPSFTVLYEVPTKPSGVLASMAYVNPGATAPHLHLQVKKGVVYPPADS
jgi:hypothetical protein